MRTITAGSHKTNGLRSYKVFAESIDMIELSRNIKAVLAAAEMMIRLGHPARADMPSGIRALHALMTEAAEIKTGTCFESALQISKISMRTNGNEQCICDETFNPKFEVLETLMNQGDMERAFDWFSNAVQLHQDVKTRLKSMKLSQNLQPKQRGAK